MIIGMIIAYIITYYNSSFKMNTPIYVSLSKQAALMRQLEVIANNVANSSTSGFQKEYVIFNQFNVKDSNNQKIAYANDIATIRDTSSGSINYTNRPLDVAISGRGYFKINSPLGPRYSRGGNFQTDDKGVLVDANYYSVLAADGGEIAIEPGAIINISEDGKVWANNDAVAQLGIFDFDNDKLLENVGRGLFKANTAEKSAEDYFLISGALEESNVKSIAEMQDLIETQRFAEMTNNIINLVEDLQQNAVKVLSDTAK